jgi:hypothetical protein
MWHFGETRDIVKAVFDAQLQRAKVTVHCVVLIVHSNCRSDSGHLMLCSIDCSSMLLLNYAR